MNIIPSTIDEVTVPYTVVGGELSVAEPRWPVSVLVLNRGGRFHRAQLIETLARQGYAEIICLDHGQAGPDLEGQCRALPGLRFLILSGDSNPGLDINIGIREARFPFVYVLWSDLSPLPFVESRMREALERRLLCTVPALRSAQGETLPSLAMPAAQGKNLRIVNAPPSPENLTTLFPADYVGLYDRERFIQSQGYDPYITHPFWQKMDFGCRAWLWGESIRCQLELRLEERASHPSEDTTPTADYARFYLKNLLPVFGGDQADLPWSRFPAWMGVNPGGWGGAWRDFRLGRTWVRRNAYRFRHDVRFIVELWQAGGGS